jgi:hypothetical protein
MTVEFERRAARLRLDHARLVDGHHHLSTTLDVELSSERPTPREEHESTATV